MGRLRPRMQPAVEVMVRLRARDLPLKLWLYEFGARIRSRWVERGDTSERKNGGFNSPPCAGQGMPIQFKLLMSYRLTLTRGTEAKQVYWANEAKECVLRGELRVLLIHFKISSQTSRGERRPHLDRLRKTQGRRI